MKLRKKSILIFVFAFLLSIMGANVTRAYTNVDVAFNFHDALAPYGSWVNVSTCGNCWQPRVNAGFIPYTNGHWVYTTYGPTWVGYEPWAWCAYHYGQWVFTPEFGWIWQPGYSYTPGRVVWATGPDYIGWTPYVAGGGPNVNFWVVVNRDRFGYSNYSNYVLRRDAVHGLFDRRVVRVQSGALSRVEAERITRRTIREVPVDVRQVSADHRTVKLILPKGHETNALREISHAQQRGQSSAKAVSAKKTTTQQVNQLTSSKHHAEVKPAMSNKPVSKSNKNVTPQKSVSSNRVVNGHHEVVNSHRQTEPKKVESKKVEVNSSSKHQISKPKEQTSNNNAEKQHVSSSDKPHANVDAKEMNSKHQNEKDAKSKQSSSHKTSHKKQKPPQSH